MNNKTVNIDWLIAKIDYELSKSTLSRYTTTTGKQIVTDQVSMQPIDKFRF